MNLKLTDRTALVSGLTKGIGFAIATGLAREGARIIVNGRSEKAVAEAKAQMGQTMPNARIESFAGDLSTAAATEALLERFPHVDILVNNLGIFEPKPFEDIPDEDWRRFFEVNVLSGVRLSRAYLPGMKQRNWGRIVFISSESAIQIPVEMIHYGMTKTAQLAVSRGLAESCAGTGVTVNAVCPVRRARLGWMSLWRSSAAANRSRNSKRSSLRMSSRLRFSSGLRRPKRSPIW